MRGQERESRVSGAKESKVSGTREWGKRESGIGGAKE